ncbi:glycosyltransferase family 4 protein [Exiguobacterium sp.]|uniref:glycosyltransferase family 4 protein n=1 Tax=Exiguobacterium sp. TaxID=44751 RepID=UPI00263B90B1|nr:glycosyltransferase family 4 protein [Exiguobacterium sp.]MCC5893805.1 glycosyltransferase family 4 protein [Exiguobacterium sp.]
MNILHLNTNYRNSKIHYNIVKHLNEIDGVDGVVVLPDLKESNYKSDYTHDKEWEEMFLKKINCLNSIDKFMFHLRAKKVYKMIKQNVNVESYDHTLAHSLYSNGFLALKLKEYYGITYSLIVTNTDINKYMKLMPHLKSTALKIMDEAENIIYSSPAHKHRVLESIKKYHNFTKINEKSCVIPFGVDTFWLQNKRNINVTRELDSEVLKILYVGKINANKNIQSTLEALNTLKKEIPKKIEFHIVGEPVGKSGQKILKNLKKDSLVKYHGIMKENDLLEKYRNSDLFIMPSLTESFGLVYVEAMSQGLPLIYSKGEGFDQHFNDGIVGVAVNAKETNQIKEAVIRILDNYSVISNNSIEKVDNFNWVKIANCFAEKMGRK